MSEALKYFLLFVFVLSLPLWPDIALFFIGGCCLGAVIIMLADRWL